MDTKRFFIILLFVVVRTVPVAAQPSGPDFHEPSSSSHAWTYAGIGGAFIATAIMFHYDQQIYDELYAWKRSTPVVKKISPAITTLGDGTFSVVAFGTFLGYGLIFKSEKAVEVGKVGMESFLFTGITVQLIKHLCGRERPSYSTRPGGFWHGPNAFIIKEGGQAIGIGAFDSFPSGHTTSVFAAATVLSDAYPAPWVSYTCYSLATLTGISRITESTHWLSDVFIGAIIGHYGARLVEYWNYGSKGFSVLPIADEHQYGLLLTVQL